MVKESVRKCSQCGRNGHNSRSCNGKCVKLFGVNLLRSESIKKSWSTGNMSDHQVVEFDNVRDDGYGSDGVLVDQNCIGHERKKGKLWIEKEHIAFLAGLKKLGKGDWKGISKKYVRSRTPTQVASHAQKYFIRKAENVKKKRRSSLFDMTFKESAPDPSAKTVETSEKASTSQVLPLNDTVGMPAKACSSTQIANQIPPLCLDGLPVVTTEATCGTLNHHDTPHMLAGIPGNGQSFPSATVVPTMSFVPATSYPVSGILCQDPMGTLLLVKQYSPPIWYSVANSTS